MLPAVIRVAVQSGPHNACQTSEIKVSNIISSILGFVFTTVIVRSVRIRNSAVVSLMYNGQGFRNTMKNAQ